MTGALLGGCSATGPSAIESGRLAYNEAINETNGQQMLMVLVHNRYEEPSSLLSVASVTANVRVTAGTAVELGVGDSDNFAGNLVPFRASAVYEENPTISYVPVAGQKYLAQLSSPVSMATLARLTGTLADPALVYRYLVSSVNGIYNPDFLFSSGQPDPRFDRFVAIMTELTRMHRLRWAEQPQHPGRYAIVIHDYAPAYTALVRELMDLAGLPAPGPASQPLVMPVSPAPDGRDAGGIGIGTRSVLRLIEILSAAVEPPPQHVDSGMTTAYPPLGHSFSALRIRHADDRPARTSTAVPYRDGWFYIGDQDQATKQFFRLMGLLWSTAIAEGAAGGSAPVLTVPVSR